MDYSGPDEVLAQNAVGDDLARAFRLEAAVAVSVASVLFVTVAFGAWGSEAFWRGLDLYFGMR